MRHAAHACLAGLVLVLTSASPAAAAIDLRAEAGFDGYYMPGAPIPVRITVSADRLIRGTVEAVAPGMQESVRRPIEVPGGSRKRFALLVPTFPGTAGEVQIVVRDAKGRELVRRAERLQTGSDVDLVGILPRLLGSRPVPGPATLAADAGIARFFALDATMLSLGPRGLSSVGTVAAARDDLAALAEDHRRSLLLWLAGGGRLLVDAKRGEPIEGLPAAWQPGEALRAPAERGEVSLTEGAMQTGSWDRLVQPTAAVPKDYMYGYRNVSGRLADAMAPDTGLNLPRLDWLMFVLLLYVVGAGPVAYIVLSRGRREILLWLVVPVLAIAFTAGTYAAGWIQRSNARAVHATVLHRSAAGTTALSNVGAFASSAGTFQVRFGEGWTDPRVVEGERAEITLSPGGPAIDVPVNSGQLGVVRAEGPSDAGGLVVTAEAFEGGIRGVVRNETAFRVEEAYVIVGKNAAGLGALRPGQERTWRVAGEPTGNHYDLVGPDLWPASSGAQGGRIDTSTPVIYQLWATQGLRGDPLASGTALAVGWTKDFKPAVRINGQSLRPRGRTMLTSRASVTYSGGALPSLATRIEQVRGAAPGDGGPGSDDPAPQDEPLVLRVALPPAVTGPLSLRGPDDLAKVEIFRDGSWQTIMENPSQQQPAPGKRIVGGGVVPIPPPPPRLQPPGVSSYSYSYRSGGFGSSGGPEIPMKEYGIGIPASDVLFLRVTQQPNSAHSVWAYSIKAGS